jgi:hypothetical protein
MKSGCTVGRVRGQGQKNAANPEVIEKPRIETSNFERNAERMRYSKFRHQHFYVAHPGNPAISSRVFADEVLVEEHGHQDSRGD